MQELEQKLTTPLDDHERMDVLLQLVKQLRGTDPARAEKLAELILSLAEKTGDRFYKANALRHLGGIAEMNATYQQAIFSYQEAIAIFRELELPAEVVSCNNQLGKIYANLGDYSHAVDVLEESLRLAVSTNDKASEANSLNAFSVIYQRAGNSEKAEEIARKSLELAKQSENTRLMAIAGINLGNAFGVRKDWEQAITWWQNSLELFERINDQALVASALGNLGIAYMAQDKLELAKSYLERCMEVKERLNDVFDIARSLHNLGTVYWKLGDVDGAKALFDRALSMGDTSNAKSVHVLVYGDLAQMLRNLGDYKGAYDALERFHDLERQLFTEDMNLKTQAMEIRFEVERMEKENEIYRLRNIDLAEANEQITQQKEVIEQKNKDITDSILYAKRIQEAVLPSFPRLQNWFGELFVLYAPKDIVSGDFYWAVEKDGKHLLAVADSTGHGVPGAIMSIMGSSFLSEIVGEQGVTDPAEALAMLRKKVIAAMQQTGDMMENGDGMDIVLCTFDLAKRELVAACANNPVWLLRDGEVDEAEPDKFPVGIYPGEPRPFTNHDTELQPGDVIYLFTDGFADQFGGPKGKKFGYKQLRETLLRIYKQPVNEQRAELEKVFREWKGENEQVDDVLLVGIKIN